MSCGWHGDIVGEGELHPCITGPGRPCSNLDGLVGRIRELDSPCGGRHSNLVDAGGRSGRFDRDIDGNVLSGDGGRAFCLGAVARNELNLSVDR